MNAFFHHFAFEFRSGIRNEQLLLMNYLFPLGFYLLMGFIMPSIIPFFRETIIPAMVILGVLSATKLGIPDPLVNAREKGIFRNYKINGIPSVSIMAIPALTTMFHVIIVTMIITISAPLLFKAPSPVNWFYFALTFLAVYLACAGLGILIGVISPSSRMTVLWSQLMFVPSMLLGGLMLLYSMLPGIAGKFAQLLPPTHAMNAYNSLAMLRIVDFAPWGSILILLLTALLAFALAAYLFCWDSRNTCRRGNTLHGFLVLLPAISGIFLL